MIKNLFASVLLLVSVSGYADPHLAKDQPSGMQAPEQAESMKPFGLGMKGGMGYGYGIGMGNPWGLGPYGEVRNFDEEQERHIYTLNQSCNVTSIKSRVQDGEIEFRVCERNQDNKCRVIASKLNPKELRDLTMVETMGAFAEAALYYKVTKRVPESIGSTATFLLVSLAYGEKVEQKDECFDQEVKILEQRMAKLALDKGSKPGTGEKPIRVYRKYQPIHRMQEDTKAFR